MRINLTDLGLKAALAAIKRVRDDNIRRTKKPTVCLRDPLFGITLSSIPEYSPVVTQLDFSGSNLGTRDTSELVEIISAVPARISPQDRKERNDYFNMRFKENFADTYSSHLWQTHVNEQYARITNLNLSNNSLGNLSLNAFAAMLAAIPYGVSHIDLGANGFGQQTPPDLLPEREDPAASTEELKRKFPDMDFTLKTQFASVEEIGQILLQSGKIITLGNSDFENNLRNYLNSAQMEQLWQLTTDRTSRLHRFFGTSHNGALNNTLGELNALGALDAFLAVGQPAQPTEVDDADDAAPEGNLGLGG